MIENQTDICIKRMNMRSKPKLLFVFYRPGTNFKLAEKLLPVKDRVGNVEILTTVYETTALKLISTI